MRSPDNRHRDELTPTGAHTSRSFKCGQCGVMYSASDILEAPELGKGEEKKNVGAGRSESRAGCMTCPSCGFENCIGDAKMVDASNEDY